MENLHFLPQETTVEQVMEPAEEEDQPPKETTRKLLHPEIRDFFDSLDECLDLIVNEDRFLTQSSGFTAYSNKEVILGTQWWKYAGLSTRIVGANIIFGDRLDAYRLKVMHRLIKHINRIFLVGETGAKFALAINNKNSFANVTLTTA